LMMLMDFSMIYLVDIRKYLLGQMQLSRKLFNSLQAINIRKRIGGLC
jgi:hypothetical protein